MIYMKCPRCGIEQINFDESEDIIFPKSLDKNYEFHKTFEDSTAVRKYMSKLLILVNHHVIECKYCKIRSKYVDEDETETEYSFLISYTEEFKESRKRENKIRLFHNNNREVVCNICGLPLKNQGLIECSDDAQDNIQNSTENIFEVDSCSLRVLNERIVYQLFNAYNKSDSGYIFPDYLSSLFSAEGRREFINDEFKDQEISFNNAKEYFETERKYYECIRKKREDNARIGLSDTQYNKTHTLIEEIMEKADNNSYKNVNLLTICEAWQQYLKEPFSSTPLMGDPVKLYNRFIEECESAPLSELDINGTDVNLTDAVKYCIDIQKNVQILSDYLSKLYIDRSNLEVLARIEKYQLIATELIPVERMEEKEHFLDEQYKMLTEDDFDYEAEGLREPERVKIPLKPNLPKPYEPKYEKPGFFNRSAVLKRNLEKQKLYETNLRFYNSKMKEYDEAMDEYKEALKKYNTELSLYEVRCEEAKENFKERIIKINNQNTLKKEQLRKEYAKEREKLMEGIIAIDKLISPQKPQSYLALLVVKDEIEKVEEKLKELIHIRNSIRKSELIYPKYFNIAALTAIYEYLLAGRCNKLAGSDGAYNLYEAEIRTDRIISSFDKIVESLNTIKDTQYEAYKTVSEIKDKVSLLKSSVDGINNTLKSCETGLNSVVNGINDIKNISSISTYYSGLNAYYSKLNAEIAAAPSCFTACIYSY